MKFIFMFIFTANVFAVMHSMCKPLPNEKQYINPDFSSNYPKQVKYICHYQCNSFGIIQDIPALHTSMIYSLNDEAKGLACQGVKLTKRPWGYDFSKIVPFFVYATKLEELRDWAKSKGIPLDSDESKPLMQSLRQNLKSVGDAYIVAGKSGADYADYFKAAGDELLRIHDDLPEDTRRLDHWVNISKEETQKEFSVEYLIKSFIKSEAYWRF